MVFKDWRSGMVGGVETSTGKCLSTISDSLRSG